MQKALLKQLLELDTNIDTTTLSKICGYIVKASKDMKKVYPYLYYYKLINKAFDNVKNAILNNNIKHPPTYLSKTVNNALRDELEYQDRRIFKTKQDINEYKYQVITNSVNHKAIRPRKHIYARELVQKAIRFAKKLPPFERRVFMMVHIEGLTYRSIGKALDIHYSTAYKYYKSALNKVRKHSNIK